MSLMMRAMVLAKRVMLEEMLMSGWRLSILANLRKQRKFIGFLNLFTRGGTGAVIISSLIKPCSVALYNLHALAI